MCQETATIVIDTPPQVGPPSLPKTVQWAAGWLFVLTGLYIFNAAAALVGLHVMPLTLPLCLVLSLALWGFVTRREGRAVPRRRLLVMGICFLAAVVIFGYIVGAVWDSSNWGRSYDTEAIVRLAGGWNPIYGKAASVSEVVMDSGKALWYLDASLYAFLGHFEMAKAHTLLFAIPTFLLARHVFARLLVPQRSRVATAAALLSLANPVAVSQLFSFYGDAVQAYVFQCFLLLAVLILNEGYLHSDLLMVLGALWLFLLHSQTGGLRTALVAGAAFLIAVALLYKKRAWRWLAIRAGALVFAGFIILGFNPYVQNLIDTGSLVCTVDLVHPSMPVILEGKTWFGKFLYSMLASPDTASLSMNGLLQQFTALFHSAYSQPDVALRGFGFAGGILLLAAVLLLIVALFVPSRRVMEDNAISPQDYLGRRIVLLWLALPVLVLALFTPTLWWARSIAVLWWLLPVAVIALSSRTSDGRSPMAKLLLTVAFLNVALVALSAFPAAVSESHELQAYWARMNATTDLPTDADAQRHNEFVTQFKTWNALKKQATDPQAEHALWTKVESLWRS